MSPKILLVDDSRTIRTIVSKTFTPYDCSCLQAQNGQEALEIAARERPDLIIMDVTMPVMDGEQALCELKKDPELKDIPVVMLTANAGLEDKIRMLRLGASDYVTKAFAPDELIELVGDLVELNPRALAV